MMPAKTTPEYINGSDLILKIGETAIGHCTSHSVTLSSDTKDRAVKPVASAPRSAGLWKEKCVTGLSISISFEGLRCYKETEGGFEEIAPDWGRGSKVFVECYHRGEAEPYIAGYFVIDSLEESAPAQDDATFSGQLSNCGEPETYPGKPEESERVSNAGTVEEASGKPAEE